MIPTPLKKKESLFERDISIGGVSQTQVALFAKHLSIMLKAGLTVTDSLIIARDSSSGKFKRIIGNIFTSVQAGNPLSSALSQYSDIFSELFINIAMAGERSGNLSENLEKVADQLKKERDLVSKIKGAMIYPIVVLTGAFFLGMILSFFILPKILPLFEGLKVDLPLSTRALIFFSHLIKDYGGYMLVSLFILFTAIFWLARQKFSRPFTHWILLRTPIVGKIVLNSNITRFTRTMGTLLKSGILLDEAIDITRDTTSNYYYREALDRVSGEVKKGSKLANNLSEHSRLFPIIVTKMIDVGEESGKFEETFFYLADFYESEVDISIKNLSTSIEPILLLLIGGVVAFLAISIITPIYSITGNIGR